MIHPKVVFCPTADALAAWYVRLFKRNFVNPPFLSLRSKGLRKSDSMLDNVPAIAQAFGDDLLMTDPGAVVLAGYSWGGLLAFELARNLSARGLTPATVVLRDTQFPDPDQPALEREVVLRQRLASINATTVARALRSDNVARTGESFLRAQRVWAGNVVACSTYLPGAYRGDVVLFTSETTTAGKGRGDWSEVVRGRLVVEEFPGHHGEFLRTDQFACRFAAVVNEAVQQELLRMRQ